jgi:hypothetical protein
MTPGQQVLIVWWLGDEVYSSEVTIWQEAEAGDCTAFYVHNYGDPLPNGEYTVELYAGGELTFAGFAQTEIAGSGSVANSGSNSGATTGAKQGDAVTVDGYIYDADSGNPINGAVVFILLPGVDVDAWVDNPVEDEILTFAETDRDGYFTLPSTLERNVEYPGVAAHEKYVPNSGYLEFSDDDPSPFTLQLDLSQVGV